MLKQVWHAGPPARHSGQENGRLRALGSGCCRCKDQPLSGLSCSAARGEKTGEGWDRNQVAGRNTTPLSGGQPGAQTR